MKTNSIDAFFALLRAGLWEKEVQLSEFGEIDYSEVLQLAEEQSIVGLLAAGIGYVTDVKPQKKDVIQFIGRTVQLEQKNQAMNMFIGDLVVKMRAVGISPLLVKGQGIAQCYERPLWRACGDVDFLFDRDDFIKAKRFFRPLVSKFDPDNDFARHICTNLGPWIVELHADQHSGLSYRIDAVIDDIQRDCQVNNGVRYWDNEGVEELLPNPDNDILFVFTHILKHFYKGGIGLRQICDLARLLYKYSDTISVRLLEARLSRMRLVTEWKAFASYMVEYLGIQENTVPLYEDSKRWIQKSNRINAFILEVGNFGRNRDTSYYAKYSFLIRKAISFWKRVSDLCRHATIFPVDAFRFFPKTLISGLESVAHGN